MAGHPRRDPLCRPPPALLLYAPFAFFEPSAVIIFWLVADALAILFVLRRMRLAWWWVLYPPLFEGGLSGNPSQSYWRC